MNIKPGPPAAPTSSLISFEVYPEECCEMCSDVIHNHFDCPSCKKSYAGTTEYGDVQGMNVGEILGCEKCGANFELVEKTAWGIDRYKWKQLPAP